MDMMSSEHCQEIMSLNPGQVKLTVRGPYEEGLSQKCYLPLPTSLSISPFLLYVYPT